MAQITSHNLICYFTIWDMIHHEIRSISLIDEFEIQYRDQAIVA